MSWVGARHSAPRGGTAANASGMNASPAVTMAGQHNRNVALMPDSPSRSASARPLSAAPVPNQLRDWEGLISNEYAAASYAANARDAATGRWNSGGVAGNYEPPMVRREGSPSVAVFGPAVAAAEKAVRQGGVHFSFDGGRPGGNNKQQRQQQQQGRTMPDSEQVVNQQTYNAWRRREYGRRLEAEDRGGEYQPHPFKFSDGFTKNLGKPQPWETGNLNFEARSRGALPTQIVGTREELAWLHPPQIPPPLGWNDFWDLCPGHELLLQMMAVSGVTPANSPSLVQHFMYKELLSCVQRLQYGTYLIHYDASEPPHERYFYVKSLPLANKAQYCPFLCWATHKNAHQATDCIPLTNVMWVTTGLDTPRLKKYAVGDGERVYGPHVDKHRIQALQYGAFAVWIFDGRKTRCLELLATDPLVFIMWMKLLEDAAQLNAALDTSGSVRALQRQIDDLKVANELDQVTAETQQSKGFLSGLFGSSQY